MVRITEEEDIIKTLYELKEMNDIIIKMLKKQKKGFKKLFKV